ncbi:MAG: CPBP family glutamic-type intramembrane protease [Candidatus Helarchaeota archaeon]
MPINSSLEDSEPTLSEIFLQTHYNRKIALINTIVNMSLLLGFLIYNLTVILTINSPLFFSFSVHFIFLIFSILGIIYFIIRLVPSLCDGVQYSLFVIIIFPLINILAFLAPTFGMIPPSQWTTNAIYISPWFEESLRFLNLFLVFDILSVKFKFLWWQKIGKMKLQWKFLIAFLTSSSIYVLMHYQRFGEGPQALLFWSLMSLVWTLFTFLTGNYLLSLLSHSANNYFATLLPSSLSPTSSALTFSLALTKTTLTLLFFFLVLCFFWCRINKLRFSFLPTRLKHYLHSLLRKFSKRLGTFRNFSLLLMIILLSIGGWLYLLFTHRLLIPTSGRELITPLSNQYHSIPPKELEKLRYADFSYSTFHSISPTIYEYIIKIQLEFHSPPSSSHYWLRIQGTFYNSSPSPNLHLNLSLYEIQSNLTFALPFTEATLGTEFQYDIELPPRSPWFNFTFLFHAWSSPGAPIGFSLHLNQFALLY